ncbi:MAG TPA: PepSY domain-containing protein [Nitrospiraceae bacterium]|nr:PepSY domain-containing protein [Nitrospiraceae bacterium]
MSRTYPRIALILGLMWVGTVQPSYALFGLGDSDKKELIASAMITLQQAVDKAVGDVPGTVVEAELEKHDGRVVYEIEIIDEQGKECEVLIDARTGETIKIKRD